MWKTGLAVVVGYVAMLMMLAGAYLVAFKFAPGEIPRAGSTPGVPVLLVIGGLCLCIGVLGAWLTMTVAGRRPFPHGIALACLVVSAGALKPVLRPNVEPLSSLFTAVTALAAGTFLVVAISSRHTPEPGDPR